MNSAIPPGGSQAQFDQEVLVLPNYCSQQVGSLTITLSDPPTLADAQAIVDKLNQYITALSAEG